MTVSVIAFRVNMRLSCKLTHDSSETYCSVSYCKYDPALFLGLLLVFLQRASSGVSFDIWNILLCLFDLAVILSSLKVWKCKNDLFQHKRQMNVANCNTKCYLLFCISSVLKLLQLLLWLCFPLQFTLPSPLSPGALDLPPKCHKHQTHASDLHPWCGGYDPPGRPQWSRHPPQPAHQIQRKTHICEYYSITADFNWSLWVFLLFLAVQDTLHLFFYIRPIK